MENEDDYLEIILPEKVLLILACCFCAVMLHFAAVCVIKCIDVVRYTIPAGYFSKAAEFSLSTYLRETGLRQHFSTMPQSAQFYILRNGIAVCAHVVLSVLVAVVAIRHWPAEKAVQELPD